MALGQKHSDTLLEQACERALAISGAPSYKTVKTLIARIDTADEDRDEVGFAYLRGADYYEGQQTGDSNNG
jgi:hypothetical protein